MYSDCYKNWINLWKHYISTTILRHTISIDSLCDYFVLRPAAALIAWSKYNIYQYHIPTPVTIWVSLNNLMKIFLVFVLLHPSSHCFSDLSVSQTWADKIFCSQLTGFQSCYKIVVIKKGLLLVPKLSNIVKSVILLGSRMAISW